MIVVLLAQKQYVRLALVSGWFLLIYLGYIKVSSSSHICAFHLGIFGFSMTKSKQGYLGITGEMLDHLGLTGNLDVCVAGMSLSLGSTFSKPNFKILCVPLFPEI